jgi:hypothetical protein
MALTASCATIPKASVNMSVRLEQQLYALKQANQQLVNAVYDAKEQDMVSHVDNVLFPQYLDGLFENQYVMSIWDDIVATNDMTGRMEAIRWLNEKAQAEYKMIKDSLTAPIKEEKKLALKVFEDEYNMAIRMNSAILRNIASFNDVQEAYNEYANKILNTNKLDSILFRSLYKIDTQMDKLQQGVDKYSENEDKIKEILKKLK